MFHVELRQFPHVAREFNLAAEDVQARIVGPWIAGQVVQLGERKWAPERARLTIYESRQLRPDEIGMGRGWASATKNGEDVTDRLVEQAQSSTGREAELAEFKQQLLQRCREGPTEIRDSVQLAGALHPGWRASERLGLAEQAVWELLHAGALRIVRDDHDVDRREWEMLLLAWNTWATHAPPELYIDVRS